MPPGKKNASLIPIANVQQRIILLRGQRVILAADLARLYGVTTRRLNEQVKRNLARFPEDFMFQLTAKEVAVLRSRSATSNSALSGLILKSQFATSSWGGARRARPYAFTEHGAIMAATVLNSPTAVAASLFVVRAFVKLRELLSTHHQLADKLAELERKLQDHDGQIIAIIDAIRELMAEPDDPPKPPVGFHTEIAPAPHAKRKKLHAPKT